MQKDIKAKQHNITASHIGELAGLLALPGNRQGDNPDSHRLELPDELSTSFRKILKHGVMYSEAMIMGLATGTSYQKYQWF